MGIKANHCCRPLLGAILAVLLFASGALKAQVMQDSVPELSKIDVIEHPGDTIPLDLIFTNDSGKEVKLNHYFHQGKPVLLVLAYYTCPMLCTLVLNGVSDGLRELGWLPGDKFQVLTISIDPAETAELAAGKKQRYLESLGRPGADWDFCVGAESQSRALADALGFRYYWNEERKEWAHPAVLFVLTEDGVISRYFYGLEYKAADLKLALLEASEGKIGSTLDRIILYCYHYDPDAGSYTLFAANVMRLGGAVTLLLLALIVGTLWFKERYRKSTKKQEQ